jgi:uncharacterized protein (TIGR00730 family)
MRRLCVFCGSSSGLRPEYQTAAETLGRALSDRGIGLVYGGAHVGLMGAVADAVLRGGGGGEVIGVIPRALVEREIAHRGLTELRVVGSMHERKAVMADLADGFVALPGGAGTLEELFEVWTWAQLGLHRKPCGLLNVNGYFDALGAFLDHASAEQFLRAEHRAMLIMENDPAALLDRFARYSAPVVTKWRDPIDVLAWVCVREGRMLATRTRGKSMFCAPGGKRQAGESDAQALSREIAEELGVALQAETMALVDVVQAPAHGEPAGTMVRMTCYAAEPVGDIAGIRGKAEVDEVAWLTSGDRGRCAPAAARLLERLQEKGLLAP